MHSLPIKETPPPSQPPPCCLHLFLTTKASTLPPSPLHDHPSLLSAAGSSPCKKKFKLDLKWLKKGLRWVRTKEEFKVVLK